MPTEIPWTFKTWIANFKDVDLPIGDLARDICVSDEFPAGEAGCEYFSEYYDYIASKSNNRDEITECFRTVWQFYEATR